MMEKFKINDYFIDPKNKIVKKIIYKSDNVIAFMLNINKGEVLPAHTHLSSTLLLQVLEGKAMVTIDGNQTPLNVGEIMKVEGQESMQVKNVGDDVLRVYVTISPIGMDGFAEDADI